MSSRGLNRRGHLSTKVPNVKLRPSSSAAPGKKREASPLNAMDEELLNRAMAGTEDEELSSAALRSTRKPWERVVITFTGVEDKPRLAEMAKQLGATIESALTISVTHVVATGFGSAKYLYAVEHRLPVMRPSWIEDAHSKWVGAEEVDVMQSMEGQRLLAFEGLTISISGIEPLERRKQIVQQITINGGTYAKDLDREATHLVTAQPTNIRAPSEKVKWAVKELAARDGQRRAGKKVDKEDMKIVYEDWIWDCVGFEGRWKEDWYDARKVRRANRMKYEDVISGQAKALMDQAVKVEAAVKEEPALLKKRKRDALDNLVGDIISTAVIPPTGKSPTDSENNTKPIKSESGGMTIDPTPGISGRRPDLDTQRIDRKPSMLHSTRSSAFASAGPSKLSRDISADITNTSSSSIPSSVPQRGPVVNGEQPKPIFAGMKFTPVMADNTDTLVAALRAHGGEVVDRDQWEAGEKTDYVIVRLYASLRPNLDHISEEARPQIVTECWIEGCCYEQQLIPLDSHIVFKPLVGSFPISEAAGLRVHLSGFSTENTVYLKRLMKAIGLTISDKLNRQTTHLVCAQPAGNKYNKALEWNVVPVRDSWVLAMGRKAAIEPDEPHRHDPSATAQKALKQAVPNVAGEAAQSVKNEEEDEKPVRRDTDVHMGSISNNSLSRQPTSTSQTGSLDNDHLMASSSPSISAMRKLKLTPTHIDDQSLNPNANPASRSTSMTTTTVPATSTSSFPLSPPKQGTERLLNQATGLPTRRVHSEADAIASESIESKLSRTSSVPASAGSGLEKGKQDIRSTSLTGLGRSDMSEMLKQLQQGDIASSAGSPGGQSATGIQRSTKPLRRARPSAPSGGSSRLRTSVAYPTSPPEGSEAGDTTANDTTLRFSSSPPMIPPEMGMGGMEGYDESVRVNYVDPAAEKERKKLLDALRKGAMAASRNQGEEGVSSAKKRRI